MSFDGSINCWRPSQPVIAKTTPRLRVAKFGDGYEQRMLDGINPNDVTWSVSFENRLQVVLNEMDQFLAERKASAFPFRHPGDGILYMVFCDEWQIEWHGKKWKGTSPVYYGTLSADFRKAFGSGI